MGHGLSVGHVLSVGHALVTHGSVISGSLLDRVTSWVVGHITTYLDRWPLVRLSGSIYGSFAFWPYNTYTAIRYNLTIFLIMVAIQSDKDFQFMNQ